MTTNDLKASLPPSPGPIAAAEMSGQNSAGRLAASPAPGAHIPSLDGIRGLAILMVLIHHFVMFADVSAQSSFHKFAFSLGYAGWLGVDLFFVLSGFLITSILVRTKDSPHYFRNFIGRRALRIFPLYFAVLALFFVFAPHLAIDPEGVGAAVGEQVWYWTYLYNFYVGLHGWSESPLSHFWSLAVEEQFYLVWPLAVYFLSRRRLQVLCGILIALAFVFRSYYLSTGMPVAANTFLWARMDSLVMGAVAATLGSGAIQRYQRWSTVIFATAVAGLGGLFAMQRGLYNSDSTTLLWAPTLAALAFVSVVARASVTRQGLVHQVLTSRVLRWFGTYSYGLYVFHRPAIDTVKSVFAQQLENLPFFSKLAALSLTSLGLTVALAMISWRLLEAPFLKLKRYL